MDDKLTYYKRLWNLSDDGEPFTTHSSLLQPVLYGGTYCILKIALGNEERRGNGLMAWYNGAGAAPVLQYDGAALLMERTMESNSLVEMAQTGRDDEASRIICQVVAKLHVQEGSYPHDLIPLTIWFESLGTAAAVHGGIFAKCSQVANGLLNDPMDHVVLHGDIHHGNILDFGSKGWLAIDPKGLLGERGFDYANLFCNPDVATATAPGRLMKQVDIISKEARLDGKRLLQWIAAWAGLSAAWAMADKTSAEPAMTVAKLALGELGFY
jgi:streptomycin 6-kinase